MNQVFAVAALAASMAMLSGTTLAAGNPSQGQAKSITCVTCHGADGMRDLPLFQGGSSHLAGMSEQKLLDALKAYRSGQRFHPMMQFFVMPMSDQDMADVAAYYAGLGAKPSLYQRLGGKEAIRAVVKDVQGANVADPRLAARMAKKDLVKCENLVTDLLCEATGGPCKYAGRDLKTAHTGANVSETEWQAFAENLGKTFERFNLPAGERQELLQLIGPLKAHIVGH